MPPRDARPVLISGVLSGVVPRSAPIAVLYDKRKNNEHNDDDGTDIMALVSSNFLCVSKLI